MNDTTKRVLLGVVLPLLIVIVAGAIARGLIKSRPTPERQSPVDRGVLVEVEEIQLENLRMDVDVLGVVMPSQRVVLQPQVAGAITWVNPEFLVGGQVKAGDILVKIDRRDYQIAVDERRSAVDQAEAQLSQERGQQVVAEREWALFKESANEELDPSLALRAPQRRIAEVNVEASKSRLKKAQLDLERTTLRAPFNAFVQAGSVEVGQVVSPQSQVATLVGTDEFWVQVSVPVDSISMIDIPGLNALEGSTAEVAKDAGASTITRKGDVLRLLPELDPVGKMARLMIRVADPLDLRQPIEARKPPLLLGAQVRVKIAGARGGEVSVIPRSALHDGGSIYVFEEGKLKIRPVSVVRKEREHAWLSGVEPGTKLITSRIASPVEGLKLRTQTEKVEP